MRKKDYKVGKIYIYIYIYIYSYSYKGKEKEKRAKEKIVMDSQKKANSWLMRMRENEKLLN